MMPNTKTNPTKDPLADEVHDKLFQVLQNPDMFSNWPKRKDSQLRQKVYKRFRSGRYEIKKIHDPADGKLKETIVESSTGKIVLKKSEVQGLVKKYYDSTKGEGARKLKKNIASIYSGTGERPIHKILNKMKEHQQLRPAFKNKAPLKPITARTVQERNQIDLVDMSSLAIKIDDKSYKYILSVIDIFSRYLHLRPLEAKDSCGIARALVEIYNDHGTPDIIQSDQGSEFKGTVSVICKEMKVKIIRSSAYTPTSQGKDERSHTTWKEKLRYDMMERSSNEGLNWVENLPLYQKIYNESPHRSLGLLCPFEVYYGRKPNSLKNRLYLDSDCEYEPEEEVIQDSQADGDSDMCSFPTADDLKSWASIQSACREKASKASNKAAQKMIERNLKKNPPSKYDVGETVRVRVIKQTAAKKTGKKLTLKTHTEGDILKTDHIKHRYNIKYTDPKSGTIVKKWFSVNDVTSLTLDDEANRQKKAAKETTDMRTKRGKALSSQKDSQNDVSQLDKSIAEILENRKLSGDTICLYFEYLKQKGLSSHISLANSYFYPSIKRNPPTYKGNIGDKPLENFEYLVVPVNLPNMDHWLLVVISVISMCIHIYDSYEKTHKSTLASVFGTIKKFISKERHFVTDKEKRDVIHEDNWIEKIELCNKQTNSYDCGIFTCLFAKNLIASNFLDCNSSRGIHRSEMISDLCELATISTSNVEPDWLFSDQRLACASYETNDICQSEKLRLDHEVSAAGLTYRQPATPGDGNCMFHAMSDQLKRLNMPDQTPEQLRQSVVEYLRSHPTTPDGNHLKDFVSHRAWDTYLTTMSKQGTWGDWIVLWGLVNMLSVELALVSSLGQNALRIISPDDTKKRQGIESMAIIGHEAEYHYHSLEPIVSETSSESLINKFGRGEITEKECLNCGEKFESVSSGIHVSEGGSIKYISDDQTICDRCSYFEMHPDVDEMEY